MAADGINTGAEGSVGVGQDVEDDTSPRFRWAKHVMCLMHGDDRFADIILLCYECDGDFVRCGVWEFGEFVNFSCTIEESYVLQL